MNRYTARQRERGAVLLEFALILPLLVILLLTIVDLGLVIRDHQVLQNAAREAARFSSLKRNEIGPQNSGASVAVISQQAVAYCQAAGIMLQATDVTIDQGASIAVGGVMLSASRVTITHTRNLLIAGAPFLPVGQLQLRGEAVFRNLY